LGRIKKPTAPVTKVRIAMSKLDGSGAMAATESIVAVKLSLLPSTSSVSVRVELVGEKKLTMVDVPGSARPVAVVESTRLKLKRMGLVTVLLAIGPVSDKLVVELDVTTAW